MIGLKLTRDIRMFIMSKKKNFKRVKYCQTRRMI